ncbi:MAG: hypothetical protein Q7J73_03350, partial [Dehalococcoidales bacterium]|nr:hypothetical protein [Dehalococcoidales bacterium]
MVQQTSGNVGIGNTAPAQLLHVGSSVIGAGATRIRIENNDGSSAILADGGIMQLEVGDSPRVTIDGSGNVGIGTTTPTSLLGVHGTGYVSGTLFVGGVITSTSTAALSITGLAGSASVLSPGRTINGVAFTGAANIVVASTTLLADVNTFTGANAYGTPSSLVLTNATGLPVAGGGTGASTLTGLLQGNGTGAITGITGTAGQFPYYNGTNTLTATSSLFLATSGNVGIGTTAPGYKLTIKDASTDGVHLSLRNEVVDGREWRLSSLGSASSPGVGAFSIYVNGYNGTAGGTNDDLYAFVIKENGNVGIGTTSPSAKLSIKGGGTTTGRAFVISDSGNVEKLTVLDSGNVGIGTTTPGALLDVADGESHSRLTGGGLELQRQRTGFSSATTLGTIKFKGMDTDNGDLTYTGAEIRGVGDGDWGTDDSPARMEFYTTPDGSSTGLPRMTIKNDGNVGIGTTNPQNILTLNKQGVGATSPGIDFFGSSPLDAGSYNSGRIYAKFDGEAYSDARITFATALNANSFTDTLSLKNGNVGIGTTSPSMTYGKLSVAGGILIGDDSSAKLSIGRYSAAVPNAYIKLGTLAESLRITNAADSVDLVTIKNDGNVGIGTTSPATKLSVQGNGYFSGTGFFGGAITGTSTLAITGTGDSYILGNFGVGTTTPAYKLDVNGDFRVGVAGATANSLYVNTTTGTVGIGTTSPESLLTLQSNAPNISGFDADDNHGWRIAMQDKLYIQDGVTGAGGTRLTIDQSGNVGIGTTAPWKPLDVLGSGVQIGSSKADTATAPTTITFANSYLQLGGQEQNTNSYRLITFGYNNNARTNPPAYLGYQEVSAAGYGMGDLIFGTRAVTSDTAATERMRINTSGNVGIGTTVPNAKLTIAKTTEGLGMLDLASDQQTAGNTSMIRFGEVSRMASDDDSRKGAIIYESTGSWNRGSLIFALDNTADVSNVTVADAIMTLKSTGNVGIGTTSPATTLSVQGNGYFSGTGFFGGAITGTSTLAITGTGDSYILGNVGIGTTTPGGKLEVYAANNVNGISLRTGASNAYGAFSIGRTSAEGYLGIAGNTNNFFTGTAAGDLVLETVGAQKLLFATNALARMTISSTGDVGVGTTTPAARLHVFGSAYPLAEFERAPGSSANKWVTNLLEATANSVSISDGFGPVQAFGIKNSVGTQTSLGYVGAVRDGADNSGALVFDTYSTAVDNERMRITSTGNVGIGTTSPSNLLQINSGATPTVAQSKVTANGAGAISTFVYSADN